ncbi:TfuA-like protein [Streptomyces sp. NPDC048111]|uniref:TfuA-like protein n=1 Tax=Streptomyces sp. NPDC048111 TaxID=3365500 RepID=UPI00371F34B9
MDPHKIAVFAGPSLVGSPFLELIAAVLRPPVRAGDLPALVNELDPGAQLLIIDGEFGQSQAVTLTEIRDVAEAGFRLYGASSMGALRAVECAPVGMVGIGRIWADYASGRLVADDEVALTYDAESYAPFTVPLVSVRRLTELLAGFGASHEEAALFLAEARAVHFRERSFSCLKRIATTTLPSATAEAAHRLLRPAARRLWDAKLADAETALTQVLSGTAPQPRTDLVPVPSEYEALLAPVEGVPPEGGPAEDAGGVLSPAGGAA